MNPNVGPVVSKGEPRDSMEPVRVLHYLNQFFAGLGGEEQTGLTPRAITGPVGPGRALETLMGGGGRVVATLVCGDNAFARDPAGSLEVLVALARAHDA